MEMTPEGRRKFDEALERPASVGEQIKEWGTKPDDQAAMAAFFSEAPEG